MIEYADVIVDLQYGDTGKGKVALALADDYDVCLRYNGGGNAGHTVYHNGQKVVLHQIPVGILKGKISIIGPGCVIEVSSLYDEVVALRKMGVDVDNLLRVDYRAHLVLKKHLEEDAKDTKIGTTKKGIGPAYRDKYERTGIRALSAVSAEGDFLPTIDVLDYWFDEEKSYKVLCEGAQGYQLDIDFGQYPYVTSSHCITGSVCLNGIPPQKIRKVYGILKAYTTYVGSKDFEPDDEDLRKLREVGGEFGATTGRPRKCNWLNLQEVIPAAQVNGVTDFIINKLDVFEQVGIYKVYDKHGVLQTYNSISHFRWFVADSLRDGMENEVNVVWSSSPNGI